jgi:4'-phosphopantetheinyl transferase
VAARTLLRQILAEYVDASPERLRFGYGAQGKPFLLDAPDLHFNLSHTADLLVVAVARGRPVGVDVEAVATDAVIDLVAPVVLSPPELAMCRRLSGQTRREAFARIWTRKEAYIKADGRGLSFPLMHIDVATSEHRVRLRDDARDAWTACSRWTLQPVEVAPGYAATVAAEGSDWRSACSDWDG